MTRLKGRVVCRGKAGGQVLYSTKPISFFGGLDPKTGKIVEKGHPLKGKGIGGKVLVFPCGTGSTVGSYILYRLKKAGKAPKAMVLGEAEAIVAVGAIMAGIPCIHRVKINKLKNFGLIEVDAEKGVVTRLG